MPELGQIKQGWAIGQKCDAKYIWHACLDCGKPRWVQLKKGTPVSSRCGHCAQLKAKPYTTKEGYIKIWLPPSDFFRPMCDRRGYVRLHRLVVAKSLGRCLQPWEIVHHRDNVKRNNEPSNLQLTTVDYHNQMTLMQRAIKKLQTQIENQNIKIKLLNWHIRELQSENSQILKEK